MTKVVAPPPAAAPPAAPPGPSDAAIDAAHQQLLGDGAIQFELKYADPPPQTPDWLQQLLDMLRSGGPVARWVFYAALAALVLGLLYLLAKRLKDGEWHWLRQRSSGPEETWRPDEAPARQLLAEADALAAAGRYSEAAHLLLFRSIEDIETRRPELLRPALTSRDIAALEVIPEQPRGAFARIAAMVERSLFARRDLGEGDWRDCRAAYEDFAFAGGWRG